MAGGRVGHEKHRTKQGHLADLTFLGGLVTKSRWQTGFLPGAQKQPCLQTPPVRAAAALAYCASATGAAWGGMLDGR